jgi:hypothetical protein
MAWSWSHSGEAYEIAHRNLYLKSRDELKIIFAEWKSRIDEHDLDEDLYDQFLRDAKDIPIDVLVGYIWDQMSEQAICTNGGHEAWACPYGCYPHLVSFSQSSSSAVG